MPPSMPRLTSECLAQIHSQREFRVPPAVATWARQYGVVLAAGLIVAAVTAAGWYWWAGAIAAATLALINLSVYLRTERARRRPHSAWEDIRGTTYGRRCWRLGRPTGSPRWPTWHIVLFGQPTHGA
jgi:hypothetical protein